jgi:hypothetical protein
MPSPGAREPVGRVATSPGDCSPSRARLGRVAAMLREAEEAEEAAPVPGRRPRDGRDAGGVVSLLPRRARATLPRPRSGRADVSGAERGGAHVELAAARRRA